jgi:hypothetical protein
VSVDTYLKGKRLQNRYQRFDVGGNEVLVAFSLINWSESVTLDARRFLLRHRLKPIVEHRHHPT